MGNNNTDQNVVHGFKVFRYDWTCSPFGNRKQYTCPGKFEEEGELDICKHGMHFCQTAADCFNYYNFDSDNRVAEVIAYGNVITEGNKSCTDKLEILREIPWDEVLRIVNIGKNCTGYRNTGDRNTGNCNTGYRNTGDRNTGNCNTGDRNTGNCNTGDWNTGYRNVGNYNIGAFNIGDYNIGNYNTGDWNTSSYNTGCFNTKEQNITLFNKPSDMTLSEWNSSDAKFLLCNMKNSIIEWVHEEDMTDEEKVAHPTYETTGGYLKVFDKSEYGQLWWSRLSDMEKKIIKAIPNFDAEIFFHCTGIRVDE